MSKYSSELDIGNDDVMIIVSITTATETGYHLTKNLKMLKKLHGRKKDEKATLVYGINLLT